MLVSNPGHHRVAWLCDAYAGCLHVVSVVMALDNADEYEVCSRCRVLYVTVCRRCAASSALMH